MHRFWDKDYVLKLQKSYFFTPESHAYQWNKPIINPIRFLFYGYTSMAEMFEMNSG